MLLIPAIDLRGGRCVRLEQGDFNRDTVYSDDPLDVARTFVAAGASWLHIVDLDGAATGTPAHLDLIGRIKQETGARVEMGGGIRSMETLNQVLETGIDRAVLGTAAVNNRPFLKEALLRYHDRIVVGIDSRGGMVATHGWQETTPISAIDLAQRVYTCGACRIIATDIARDGMRSGPDLDGLRALKAAVPIPIIASGGVAHTAHLRYLTDVKVEAVIVGRALYTGDITLEAAAQWLQAGQAV